MESNEEIMLSGRYQLLERLGAGGMANVFRGLDQNLQREVAIKILRSNLIEDPSFRASFLQEARAAANLSHPNIVTIYDYGHDAERYFIVMEYIKGTDLKTLIREEKKFLAAEAVEMMLQVCAGVGYAHRAGLVHCDLKPHNILVSPDGRVKITDFGISRALAAIHPDEKTEIVWGSPQYFAPEQAAGSAPSPSSDVYSLGVILYEMLTGQLPFASTSPSQLAILHQTTLPRPPRSLNPQITPPLEAIVLKVLSKEPSARYRTADQLGRVLETFTIDPTSADLPQAIEPADSSLLPYPGRGALPWDERLANLEIDWIALSLGLVAFLALSGLIPLWLWVCLLYPTCPIRAW